jgi:hypothetical protein
MRNKVLFGVAGLFTVALFVAAPAFAASWDNLTGTWGGWYKNSKGGGSGTSQLVLREYTQGGNVYFTGKWDQALIERGIRKGDQIEWVHLSPNGKHFVVHGTISPNGRTIDLTYTVNRKTGGGEEIYTGRGTYSR